MGERLCIANFSWAPCLQKHYNRVQAEEQRTPDVRSLNAKRPLRNVKCRPFHKSVETKVCDVDASEGSYSRVPVIKLCGRFRHDQNIQGRFLAFVERPYWMGYICCYNLTETATIGVPFAEGALGDLTADIL